MINGQLEIILTGVEHLCPGETEGGKSYYFGFHDANMKQNIFKVDMTIYAKLIGMSENNGLPTF